MDGVVVVLLSLWSLLLLCDNCVWRGECVWLVGVDCLGNVVAVDHGLA